MPGSASCPIHINVLSEAVTIQQPSVPHRAPRTKSWYPPLATTCLMSRCAVPRSVAAASAAAATEIRWRYRGRVKRYLI